MQSPAISLTGQKNGRILVIGAGIGGLAAALPLVHAGADVLILERHHTPGGKMRQVGGVDAGPTVLTLRTVFDDLFEAAGEALDHHVSLIPQDILARHWWPDSGPLDLFADRDRSAQAIGAAIGPKAEAEFRAFSARAKTLFDGFQGPVMTAPDPSLLALTRHVLTNPFLIPAMAPLSTLAGLLRRSFSDPRLRQLFGRYATYVGGSPYASPALLSLIWQAEAAGVWCVKGGMHELACAFARLIVTKGGQIRCDAHVTRINTDSDGVTGVTLDTGEVLAADHVVFNGDPRALATGLLGSETLSVAPQTAQKPRSMSATVWSFRAEVRGPDLVHHNVFFCNDPKTEFGDIARGKLPRDASLYVCAEDRGQGDAPPRQERIEIIRNAPPLTTRAPRPEDFETCHTLTFPALARFGLHFGPEPGRQTLTTPQGFETLFPGSAGSLYGQSPHGMTAALARPTAVTRIPGLLLCGGGCHPGAGVPMAALSGRHAAEAILTGRTSTSRSRQTAMPGGTSTVSAPAEHGQSA